jgi:hypothetical protein
MNSMPRSGVMEAAGEVIRHARCTSQIVVLVSCIIVTLS